MEKKGPAEGEKPGNEEGFFFYCQMVLLPPSEPWFESDIIFSKMSSWLKHDTSGTSFSLQHFEVVSAGMGVFIEAVNVNRVSWKVFLSHLITTADFKQSDNHYTGCGDRIVHHRVLTERGSIAVRLKAHCEKCLTPLVKSRPSSFC